MKRDEAIQKLRQHFPELRERFGVAHLSVFGSVARDEAGPESDVDILVEFSPDAQVGLFGLIELQQRLEELLGCKVDVGTPQGLRPRIRDRVLSEAVHVA
ncbi:MAG: nucleotidyltransferase family protein [Pseudomonadota bacterium]